MSSLSSSSSLIEQIDFVKYEKNPMEFLKAKYPVLNTASQQQAVSRRDLDAKILPTNNSNNVLEKQLSQIQESKLENNWNKIKKTGVGLLNLGNNCYLNATLQCLAYTPPLSQWLVSKPHSSTCRFRQMKGFCSLCEVEKIIFEIFNSCNGCAKPNSLCFNIKSNQMILKFLFLFC